MLRFWTVTDNGGDLKKWMESMCMEVMLVTFRLWAVVGIPRHFCTLSWAFIMFLALPKVLVYSAVRENEKTAGAWRCYVVFQGQKCESTGESFSLPSGSGVHIRGFANSPIPNKPSEGYTDHLRLAYTFTALKKKPVSLWVSVGSVWLNSTFFSSNIN